LELDDVVVSKTRLHIALCNGENLWFQADIAAAREIAAVLEAYREKLPRKRKSNVQLRSVAGAEASATGEEGSEESPGLGADAATQGGKENVGGVIGHRAVDSSGGNGDAGDATDNDGTAAFKEQFPVALKDPPSGMMMAATATAATVPAAAASAPAAPAAPAAPSVGLFDDPTPAAAAKKKSGGGGGGGGLFEVRTALCRFCSLCTVSKLLPGSASTRCMCTSLCDDEKHTRPRSPACLMQ
jgi:hypothetical protein